jgi:ferrous iron transport protein B
MAAREVAVSSLATTYAVGADDEEAQAGAGRAAQGALEPADRAGLPGLVRLRPAVPVDHRRHAARNEWVEMAAFMLLYLFALAYIFAGITYWSAVALGL